MYSVTPGKELSKKSFLFNGRLINPCTFFSLYRLINSSKLFIKYSFFLCLFHSIFFIFKIFVLIEFFNSSFLDPINK